MMGAIGHSRVKEKYSRENEEPKNVQLYYLGDVDEQNRNISRSILRQNSWPNSRYRWSWKFLVFKYGYLLSYMCGG